MARLYTLITGASSGMGEATAKLLAEDRNLILNGRNDERLAKVADECRAKGAVVIQFPFDLENASEVGKELALLLKANDVAVEAFLHFAGMTEVLPIARSKYSVALKVMNVNYFSAAEIISALMKKKNNAENLRNIVLVSSIADRGGKKYQPHYCASKGAITSLAMNLAVELAPKVRINVISPGSFPTRITQTVFAEDNETGAWAPPTLLPPGDVLEVAKVARFLLSEDAAYLTGQYLTIDGGEHFPRL